MRGLTQLDITVLCTYLLLLAAAGGCIARRQRSHLDYFLAGKRIPWWAAGISLLGTSLSAITFMAIPAKAYQTNWVYLPGNLMIAAVALPVIRYYLPFYRRLNVTSAYEYLELRFGLATRLTGSTTFLVFQLARMGIVIYLPALTLSTVSGWNVYLCIAAIGILSTFYTALGGIEAVIWTDVLQVIVLLAGIVVSFVIIVNRVPGGAAEIVSSAMAAGKLRAVNLTWDASTAGLWVVVLGNFFKFLIPYSSDQAVIQRYLTTNSEKDAARGIWLNALGSVPIWTAFFAMGTCLWVFYQTFPERLNPDGHPDEIFAWFIMNELPTGLAGLVVAALFAASMSSLDSSMNSMCTSLTMDFYRRFRTRIRWPAEVTSNSADVPTQMHESAELIFARIITMALGLIGTLTAVWLAWRGAPSVWDQFLKIMGLLGGGLAGMFVAGIFTRHAHQNGVLIGFAASTIVLYWVSSTGAVHFFLFGGIGILTCAIVGWMASLILPGTAGNVEGLTVHSSAFNLRTNHQTET